MRFKQFLQMTEDGNSSETGLFIAGVKCNPAPSDGIKPDKTKEMPGKAKGPGGGGGGPAPAGGAAPAGPPPGAAMMKKK
jgi:hypothetical protein